MDSRYLPEGSVLDPDRDEQLIKGLEKYASTAGIAGNKEYIWQSVKNTEWITKQDIAVVRLIPFKKHNSMGAYYNGMALSRLTKKFMMLTGLLVRHYMDARYVSRVSLFKDLQEGLEAGGKVLFIPDWYVSSRKGVKNSVLPQWMRDIVLSFLLESQAEGKDIIMGIHDWAAAEEHYGPEIMSFIENNFKEVE